MLKFKVCAIAVVLTIAMSLASCSSNKHNYIIIISESQDNYQMKSI